MPEYIVTVDNRCTSIGEIAVEAADEDAAGAFAVELAEAGDPRIFWRDGDSDGTIVVGVDEAHEDRLHGLARVRASGRVARRAPSPRPSA